MVDDRRANYHIQPQPSAITFEIQLASHAPALSLSTFRRTAMGVSHHETFDFSDDFLLRAGLLVRIYILIR